MASSRARAVAIAAIAGLLALLAGVLFVLPDIVAERGPAIVAAPPEPPAAPAPPEPDPAAAERAAARREAEALLGRVLRRQAALEADRVAEWAGDEHAAVRARVADGDAHFGAGRFEAAAAAWTEALALLDALDASRPQRLADALDAGARALEAADGEAARRAFDLALALAPEHADAAAGRARAGTIERVAALADEADALARDGDLDAARARLAEARALDPAYARAADALATLERRIAEREFARAMSDALAAIERGAFDDAHAALERAQRHRADAPALADARERLAEARTVARLRAARARAEALAADERWEAAAGAYADALAIDPDAAFAIAGRARALERAHVHAQIDAILAAPGRLASPQPRVAARRLADAAAALPERGPALAARLDALDRALAAATEPVRVALRSDGRTLVDVRRVGRLGRFERLDLALEPGRYVAHGARDGYRDVRVEFDVPAGGPPPAPVVVRCEERI